MKSVKRTKAFFLILLVSVTLCLFGGQNEIQSESKSDFDAHDTGIRFQFDDSDMDFHFGMLVLGSAVNRGVEIGESFYVASRIADGSAQSWQEQWFEMAERVEERGKASFSEGHMVSALDQFLRAAYYYRLSLISMLPTEVQFSERAEKSRTIMKEAGQLMSPVLEYIEIPFEDTVLPGYFRKSSASEEPVKTLIMIGGGETFAEDLFFYIAPQAFERGYNFMTVDLPGQGVLPLEDKPFRPDMYVPMEAVVSYALSRSDVDPEYLAVYGYSGGGGFAPQAAMHDKRIRAVAMNSAVVDAYPLFSTMPAVTATDDEKASWTSFHGNVVKVICWRWGVPMDEPTQLAEANIGFTFDASQVDVPALIIVGEGEYRSEEVKRQQKIAFDNFTNPLKKMVITPANEGGTNHCVMENRSLVGQVLFDWLDEVFQ